MHGRLKVRSSAEEAARKKKEQEQKVLAYRTGMTKILEKKRTNQYDSELMLMTSIILCKNPDVSMLWNIRRTCILQQQQEKSVENIAEMFKKDLDFTESCLLANPKSYCIWHHRCWILEHSPEPNWKQEVEVCTRYLKLDERNFHVWDYRRYVVEKAKVSPLDELNFCTEKIQKNFSNYSSWHYRSKLLPILHPHETDTARPISEEKLKEELELVLTAAFTDPNDSSAWFYQRWLLGNSQPPLDIAAFKITKTHGIISFTIPVNLHNCSVSLDSTTIFEMTNWRPLNSTNNFSTIWLLEDSFELNSNSDKEFQLEFKDEKGVAYSLPVAKINDSLFGVKCPKFGYQFEKVVLTELEGQLKSCQELLEFEPDSKWTLLTSALLMRAIDRKRYHLTSLKHLDLLKVADPLRIGYYTDLANKWSIEFVLEQWILENSFDIPVDLSQLDLVSLFYEQYLCVADKLSLGKSLKFGSWEDKVLTLRQCKVNVIL